MARVLIIAEERVARQVAWVLEEAGHTAQVVNDAQAGLREALATQPDAIVLNGVLPEESMPLLANRLREAVPDVGVIDVAQKAGALKKPVPADAHLTQPFDADDFLGELDRVLDKRDRR